MQRLYLETNEILPDEVLLVIFHYLYGRDLSMCGLVAKQWKRVTQDPSLALVLHPPLAIAVGHNHSLALSVFGECFSWGWNHYHQLGLGKFTHNTDKPLQVLGLEKKSILLIAAGYHHSLVVTNKGELYSWGWNSNGQLGLGHTAKAVSPTLVTSLQNVIVSLVSAGRGHTLVLAEDTRCFSWGWNCFGQLGLGHRQNACSPQLIVSLNGKNTSFVCAGHSHSIAMSEKGKCYAWGWNASGQLGVGDTRNKYNPTLIQGLGDGISVITAGYDHSLAVSPTGEVFCWGFNCRGQLGDGTVSKLPVTIPQKIPWVLQPSVAEKCRNSTSYRNSTRDSVQQDKIVYLAAGNQYSLALTNNGLCYSWGNNEHGQLGLGDLNDRVTPQWISALQGKQISFIAAGHSHSLAMTVDGECFSWGSNDVGQLGVTGRKEKNLPLPQVLAVRSRPHKERKRGGWSRRFTRSSSFFGRKF